MDDLVERLRAGEPCGAERCRDRVPAACLCAEAADELARMRARLARIRKAAAQVFAEARAAYEKMEQRDDLDVAGQSFALGAQCALEQCERNLARALSDSELLSDDLKEREAKGATWEP